MCFISCQTALLTGRQGNNSFKQIHTALANGSDDARRNVIEERNNVNIQLRKSKPHYFRQKIDECNKNDPNTTWKLINSLIGRSSKSKHINEVKVGNETFRDDENISEAFNEFLIKLV